MKEEELVKHIDIAGLTVIPLGGQSELGQVLWLVNYQGRTLIVDAGAAYPNRELPGVDLFLPNTSFLEANHKNIEALLLTNGNEEYLGAVPYLLKHVPIPKIMAPRFVNYLLDQTKTDLPSEHPIHKVPIETIDTKKTYKLGPFEIEWIDVNDAVSQSCGLRISTKSGQIVYLATFKLDQTPVDRKLTDISRLAQLGESGVDLLISSSAGVERGGYSESELGLYTKLSARIKEAKGRVCILMSGKNTNRLQLLIDIARQYKRKVLLIGEPLIQSAVACAMTGNLIYQPDMEVTLEDLPNLKDEEILIIATGKEGNPMPALAEIAAARHKSIKVKSGDTIIYSSEVPPGRLRQMAMLLDQFLFLGVKVYWGEEQGVHVSRTANQEELKLIFSLLKPKYFVPAFGEGRHIIHHAKLAQEWGMFEDNIFPLQNGQILAIENDSASIIGRVESQAVLVNTEHGERITTFTVNERRAMSFEGLITISLIIDEKGKLMEAPKFSCSAASFRYSIQWKDACADATSKIVEALDKHFADKASGSKIDEIALRNLVRDSALKILRGHLQTKPVLQIVIQQPHKVLQK